MGMHDVFVLHQLFDMGCKQQVSLIVTGSAMDAELKSQLRCLSGVLSCQQRLPRSHSP